MSRLAKLHSLTLEQIQQALTPARKDYDENLLVLDDALVGPLSIYMHAALLRSLNFNRWYRLSTADEIPSLMARSLQTKSEKRGRVAIFLSSSSTATEMVNRLARSLVRDQKARIEINLHFIPRRETLAVSKILHSFQELGVTTSTAQTFQCKNLSLSFADLPIVVFPIDQISLTMCQQASLRRYQLEGDDRLVGEIVNAMLLMLKSNFQINESSYVIGVGSCATRIGQALQKEIRSSAVGRDNEKEVEETPPDLRWHQTATELICNPDAKPEGHPQPVHGRALTRALNKLADRCDYKLAEKILAAEVDFVRVDPSQVMPDSLQERIDKPNFRVRFPLNATPENEIDLTSPDPLILRNVIILDRSVDHVSPFVAPFTYEALLDVAHTIEANSVYVPEAVFGGSQPGGLKLKLSTEEDPVLQLIRDLPHTELGPALHQCALQLQNTFQREKAPETWSVSDMQNFVSDLRLNEGKHRHLKDHIHITGHLVSDLIKNPSFYTLLRLEDEIMSSSSSFGDVIDVLCGMCERNASVSDIYRLAILNSHINAASFDLSKQQRVRQALYRHYGLWEVYRWQQLEKAGILFDGNKSGLRGSRNWNATKRCVLEWNANDAQQKQAAEIDFSFVHSGYSPISVKIIQALCEERRRFWPHMQRLVGEAKDEQLFSARLLSPGTRLAANTTLSTKPGFLIVLPNGCSWSELAALRYLAKCYETDGSRTLLILTAEMYGYRSFLQQYSAAQLHRFVRNKTELPQAPQLEKLVPPLTLRPPPYAEELKQMI